MRRWLALAALIVGMAMPVFAAPAGAQQTKVLAVEEGGTLRLETGEKAVLLNLYFPDSALAQNWLAEHVLQQKIAYETHGEDRYGATRITTPIAEKMLRDGAAMVYASDGEIPAAWKAAEAAARAEKRGLWAQENVLLTPENAAQHLGGFHGVEGRITRIYEGKRATYLNFGEDWHSDFSVTLSAKARRSMKPMLQQLKPGMQVRVRGAIYEENGPMMQLFNANNLEIL